MKPSSNDDPKIVYELSRKKEISVAKDKFNRSNSIIFKDQSKIEGNSEKSESDLSHAKQLRFKTNDELLAELDIIEILTEECGSEIEDIQSSIITALTDKIDIVEQELDGNCLFRALSAGWFGSPTYFNEVREVYEITFCIIQKDSKFIYLINLISILKLCLRTENGEVSLKFLHFLNYIK